MVSLIIFNHQSTSFHSLYTLARSSFKSPTIVSTNLLIILLSSFSMNEGDWGGGIYGKGGSRGVGGWVCVYQLWLDRSVSTSNLDWR